MKNKRRLAKQQGFASNLALLVAVFIIVIIAGILLFGGKKKTPVTRTIVPPAAKPTTVTTEQLEPEPTLSSSDNVEAIEKDLNATDLKGIDSDLGQVEDELKGF